MSKVKDFVRNWTLPISMVSGALLYFAFAAMPLSIEAQDQTYAFVSGYLQPVLLFSMLFLNFIKVRPREMRPRRWHLWVLLMQAGLFTACSLLAMWFDADHGVKILCEGAMLAFICPTATASAVIVGKLKGSISGIVTYIMLCNLMVSVLAPALLPLVEPGIGLDFMTSFLMILGKVFPLLIFPLLTAWAVRYGCPRLHRWLLQYPDLSFYVWSVALALAITVTVRSIMHSTVSVWYMVGLAVISGICCVIQFVLGKRVGSCYDRETRITAGQAFGQKNTVFVIWLGLVFLDPVTSVVGGFYSVWHNTVNSYQLYKARKRQS